MENRAFSFLVGVVYLSLGICGVIPSLRGPSSFWSDTPPVSLGYGFLFGIFPVNAVSILVFILIGLSGLAAAARLRTSRTFERRLFAVSVLFMMMGCLPGASRVWGLMPLFGWTDGLFTMTALLSFYFAFVDGPWPAFLNEPVVRHHH